METRVFQQYEHAYAMWKGSYEYVMVIKQSTVYTKVTIPRLGYGHKPYYARVKTDSLLPLPRLDR